MSFFGEPRRDPVIGAFVRAMKSLYAAPQPRSEQMSDHSSEPWRVVANYRIHGYAGNGGVVIGACGDPPQRDYGDATVERWAADARRIVMCVNACEGMGEMSRGSVRKLVEAAGFILEVEQHRSVHGHDEWYRDAQPIACDDLRKALREMGEDSHE